MGRGVQPASSCLTSGRCCFFSTSQQANSGPGQQHLEGSICGFDVCTPTLPFLKTSRATVQGEENASSLKPRTFVCHILATGCTFYGLAHAWAWYRPIMLRADYFAATGLKEAAGPSIFIVGRTTVKKVHVRSICRPTMQPLALRLISYLCY